MARLTALPIAPDELSTCSSAGEMRSSSAIAPSAASIGSSRAACVISASASWSRVIAGCDFHPKACLRMRVLKRQEWPPVLGMCDARILAGQARDRGQTTSCCACVMLTLECLAQIDLDRRQPPA